MKTLFKNAWGYQGDAMKLPVADRDSAIGFYTNVLGFEVVSSGDEAQKSAVLARPGIQIGLVENGGDPTQDGCAFEVSDAEALFAEFKANGLEQAADFKTENSHGSAWKVFYVVAPDGLCYWFGERLAA